MFRADGCYVPAELRPADDPGRLRHRKPPISGPPVPRSVQMLHSVLPPGKLHLAHLRSGSGSSLNLTIHCPDLPVASVKPLPGTLPVRRRLAVGGF